jgi:hypothetical protein
MRKIYLLAATLAVALTTIAQTDTTVVKKDDGVDTIKVGKYIIIKKNKPEGTSKTITIENRKPSKPSNLSTNWWILDIGFANVIDRTDYSSAETRNYLLPRGQQPFTKDDMKLIPGKTSNVNLWILMQRLNLSKGYVNLKYGVGLEMFNFRYDKNISYRTDIPMAGQTVTGVIRDSISFSKNKLYAGYLSVPLMLNFNTTPGRKKGLSFSAGVSAGYLVGSRNKQISGERGKEKTRADFDLEKFRLAYVGELGIGPVRLFGSYAMTPLHERGLEQYPYSVGIRLSNW